MQRRHKKQAPSANIRVRRAALQCARRCKKLLPSWHKDGWQITSTGEKMPQQAFAILALGALTFGGLLSLIQRSTSSMVVARGLLRGQDQYFYARPNSLKDLMQLPILNNRFGHQNEMDGFFPPPTLSSREYKNFEREMQLPDKGGLQMRRLNEGESRSILVDPNESQGNVHIPVLDYKSVDDVDVYYNYYAVDDDQIKNTYYEYSEDEEERRCRRTSWHRMHHPTCNIIHEGAFVLNPAPKYLSHGFFRDVFVLTNPFEKVILKQIRMYHEVDHEQFEYTRMDVLVAERLTSDPKIVDVYGHCGLSLLSEFFDKGDAEKFIIGGREGFLSAKELDDKDDVKPQNDLSVEDKVLTALQMAESIASLHGFKDGVLVHNDIQLGQFLITDRGTIKLNDFNRAEVMLYDNEAGEYCRYKQGTGHGNYRSPEEYHDDPLNEKIDVYSMGNNIYALLTGLYIFYDEDEDKASEYVSRGVKPFIDERYRTRSAEERDLVEIMERCWETDPDDRASIFEVSMALEKIQERIDQRADRKAKVAATPEER